MVLIEDANAFLTQISGLILSLVALAGISLKFAMSHTHNARLVTLETKAETYDTQIGTIMDTINVDKPQILKAVAVADVLAPQLGAAAAAHAAQIAELQKQLADAQAKINLLTTVVPVVAAITPTQSKQPVNSTGSNIIV
jgi:hypothetical protein